MSRTTTASRPTTDTTLDPAELFRALGHPVRFGIVRQLADEPEICACDFHEVLGISQPTVSQHLKVLREAGVIGSRRDGTKICYSVRPEAIEALSDTVALLRPSAS